MFMQGNVMGVGGDDDDDDDDDFGGMIIGGFGGAGGVGGGFGKDPRIMGPPKIKTFKGQDIQYVKYMYKFVSENHISQVYDSRFKRGPIFPLFYRNISKHQYIDWHITTTWDAHFCIQRGAFDKETGEMILGVQVGYVEEWPKLKEGEVKAENPNRKQFARVGEFKGFKLNGLGRIYTDGWMYDQGTFKDGELVEDEIWGSFEVDQAQAYFGLYKKKENEQVNLRLYMESMRYNTPESYQYFFYKKNEKNGPGWTHNINDKEGKTRDRATYENDKKIEQEEDQRPKEDYCLKMAEDFINENPKFKEWQSSGQDIREYMGLSRDPIDYIQLINNRWKVESKIQKLKEYIVSDAFATEQEDKDKRFICFVFKNTQKKDYNTCIKVYEKYKGKEDFENNLKGQFKTRVNQVWDHGEVEVAGLEKFTFYYVVVNIPEDTLSSVMSTYPLDFYSKINIFIQLIRQLQRIHKMGYWILNVDPDNIVLSEDRETFYFTKFNECTFGSTKGYNYYQAIDHPRKDILFPLDVFMKKKDPREYRYNAYGKRPENNIEPKDDIKALMHIVFDIFSEKLPWDDKDYNKAQDLKNASTVKDYFKGDVEEIFNTLCQHIMSSNSKVDYDHIQEQLKIVKDKLALPREDNNFIWLPKYKTKDPVDDRDYNMNLGPEDQSDQTDYEHANSGELNFDQIIDDRKNKQIRNSTIKDKVKNMMTQRVQPFEISDNSAGLSSEFNIYLPEDTLDIEVSERQKLTKHSEEFQQEYTDQINNLQREFVNYWSQPKRNDVTEKELQKEILDQVYTATGEEWKNFNIELFEKLFKQKVKDQNSSVQGLGKEKVYTPLKSNHPADSKIVKTKLKSLKDQQYLLYGQLQLIKLSASQKDKNCYRCSQNMNGYKYAWKNDFNFLCTDCHQDEKAIKQFLKEKNRNPYKEPRFQATDYSRLDSILNQVGGKFQYKKKPHNYIYTCVQLQDWQLNFNRDVKMLEFNEDDQSWARVVSNANCNIHSQYKNVAITYMDRHSDTKWFKKGDIQQLVKISIFEEDKWNAENTVLEEQRKVAAEEKKKEEERLEKLKKDNEGNEDQAQQDDNISEDDGEIKIEEETFNTEIVADLFIEEDTFKQDSVELLPPAVRRPCMFYTSKEGGKLLVQRELFNDDDFMYLRLRPLFKSDNELNQKTFIVPVSNVYLEEDKQDFRQAFNLCFSFEKTVLQIFEFTITWNNTGTTSVELINTKLFIGLHVKKIYSNIRAAPSGEQRGGDIDGIQLYAQGKGEKVFRWMKFKRTRPWEYSFKTSVSFNRYCKYKENCEDTNPPHCYLLESQLTDDVLQQHDNISQFMLLMSNMRTLLNMIPGKMPFAKIQELNWLQPMEILNGRSLSQYYIGSKDIIAMAEISQLQSMQVTTLIDTIRNELSLGEQNNWDDMFKELNLGAHEICFDFTYRTAIHDSLDFDNPTLVVDYRQTLISYLDEIYFESTTARQIMMGIFGLVLEMESPIEEYDNFIVDVGEDRYQRIFPELHSEKLPVVANSEYQLETLNTVNNLNFDNDQFSSRIKEQFKHHEGSVKVHHFLNDWTMSFIQTKLQVYLDHQDKKLRGSDAKQDRKIAFNFFQTKEGFKNMYDIAIFTKRINDLYGDEVEQQKCFKLFIDSQFQSTQKIIIRLFLIYFVFFNIAFIFQMFSEDPFTIVWCNVSCQLVQLILLAIEISQLYYKGMAGYWDDGWNFFDVVHFLVYELYFFVRVIGGNTYYLLPKIQYYGQAVYASTIDEKIWWVIIHSLIILLITFKLMFFMRVSENFSNLVQLITTVLFQIGPFIVFLIMWMIVNSLLYNISGVEIYDINDNDYHELHESLALFFQNFRNSVGDISTPTYDYWINAEVLNQGDLTWTQFLVVGWAWALFLLNEFFILIVLLNFLIAIIGQSYDEVMSKAEIDRYHSRCALNIEVAIKLDTFNKFVSNFMIKTHAKATVRETPRVFYLKCNTYQKDMENEFLGFVKTIKKAIKKQNKLLKNDIKKCFPNSELLQGFSEKFAKIGNLDHKVESKLNDVKSDLHSRMNDVKNECTSIMTDVKNDLTHKINSVNNDLNGQLSGIQQTLQKLVNMQNI